MDLFQLAQSLLRFLTENNGVQRGDQLENQTLCFGDRRCVHRNVAGTHAELRMHDFLVVQRIEEIRKLGSRQFFLRLNAEMIATQQQAVLRHDLCKRIQRETHAIAAITIAEPFLFLDRLVERWIGSHEGAGHQNDGSHRQNRVGERHVQQGFHGIAVTELLKIGNAAFFDCNVSDCPDDGSTIDERFVGIECDFAQLGHVDSLVQKLLAFLGREKRGDEMRMNDHWKRPG